MKDKINKLLDKRLNSDDNLIGKILLLKEHPEIKEDLRTTAYTLMLDKFYFKKYGIVLDKKSIIQFDKKYFPELWEELGI